MNYLIAVLPEREQAEKAYTALEEANFSPQEMTILGQDYPTREEFDFLDPAKKANKRAKQMAFWLVPFGFIAGFAFNVQTDVSIVEGVGNFGNHLIGGIFGAIGGGMGSIFIGGGLFQSDSGGDTLPYSNLLQAGKYLVVVRGTPSKIEKMKPLLEQFNPEQMQGYINLE